LVPVNLVIQNWGSAIVRRSSPTKDYLVNVLADCL